MAGEVGIEPTNAGIKIRCLTTWRLPAEICIVRYREFPEHRGPRILLLQHSRKRRQRMSRASVPCNASGRLSCGKSVNARCCFALGGKGGENACARSCHARAAAMRATTRSMVAATAGNRACRDGRGDHSGHNPRKRRLFRRRGSQRVNSGAAKMSAVDTAAGGNASATKQGGSDTGASTSPIAARDRVFAGDEQRNIGAQLKCQRRQLGARQAEFPQAIQARGGHSRHRSCRRPGRCPAECAWQG